MTTSFSSPVSTLNNTAQSPGYLKKRSRIFASIILPYIIKYHEELLENLSKSQEKKSEKIKFIQLKISKFEKSLAKAQKKAEKEYKSMKSKYPAVKWLDDKLFSKI